MFVVILRSSSGRNSSRAYFPCSSSSMHNDSLPHNIYVDISCAHSVPPQLQIVQNYSVRDCSRSTAGTHGAESQSGILIMLVHNRLLQSQKQFNWAALHCTALSLSVIIISSRVKIPRVVKEQSTFARRHRREVRCCSFPFPLWPNWRSHDQDLCSRSECSECSLSVTVSQAFLSPWRPW